MIEAMVIVVPFLTALALAFVARWRVGVWVNAGATTLVFLLACLLAGQREVTGHLLRLDALGVHLALLTGLVAMAAGWFGLAHVPRLIAARGIGRRRLRWGHALDQVQFGGTMLAVLSGPPLLVWLGLLAASLAAVAGTGLAHGRPAMLAARRALLLGSVSLVLALAGTVLLPLGSLVGLGAAFLLLGYGGLAGLAPLFVWTQAAARAPVLTSAQLGPLAAASLAALLRLRLALPGLDVPAWLFVSLGVATPLLAALGPRTADARGAAALACSAQCGIAAVAFGVGGGPAVTAGLLHLTLLVLAQAALLLTDDLAGRPAALTRAAGLAALAALPPFGLFGSACLVAVAAVGVAPWLAVPVGAGLLLNARMLLHCIPAPVGMAQAGPSTQAGSAIRSLLPLVPAWLMLALVLGLGLIPAPVLPWFAAMAEAR